MPMRKVEEANLPHLETGMALQYTIGEGKGRQFAENLSVIEGTKAVRVCSRSRVGSKLNAKITPEVRGIWRRRAE
jgi:hypothetical protein